MKVICNRGALLDAIGVVSPAVPARSPKPVLQSIKLSAESDKLILSATDMEIAVRYADAQVQVEQEGETLLPADKLRDIVRKSVDDTLSLELKGEKCVIKGADSQYTLFTQAPADFPQVASFEGDADVTAKGATLRKLIHKTQFATAREATRYAFNGVLTTVDNGQLVLVATDGRRLAQARAEAEVKMDGDAPKSIVPRSALSLVDKLIADPEEEVQIQFKPNQIMFATPNATVTANLVEGQFPPYQDVIPKDHDRQMTSACGDFMSAVDRASLLTTDEHKGVRMAFGDGGLKLTSRSPESGEAEINFACKYEGEDLEIGFNPQFLVDALKVVDTDEVTFHLSGTNRPGLLKSGDDFLYVIMPVNLQ